MKFFLDTADIKEIEEAASWGILDGITTNPTHVAKTGKPFMDVLKEIVAIVPGPVSAEVTATDFDGMMRQAHMVADIASNIVVKVPLIAEGLKVVKKLTEEGIKTNVTLCFSAAQAMLAAKAGAYIVSPFIGRIDDIGWDGGQLIRDIVLIYKNYGIKTNVLAASLRSSIHVTESAKAGADIGTMPFKVLDMMFNHPLTDKGLEQFLKDYNKVFHAEPVGSR